MKLSTWTLSSWWLVWTLSCGVSYTRRDTLVNAFAAPSQHGWIPPRSSTTAATSRMKSTTTKLPSRLHAAPKRLEDNVDGVVYVNDRCINCAACSSFAPSVFQRNKDNSFHVVHHQPESLQDIDHARAALAACPVGAIRVETETTLHRHQNNPHASLSSSEQELASAMALSPTSDLPFPRVMVPDVYYVGYHNEHSFGAVPYLTHARVRASSPNHDNDRDNDYKLVWIMIDTPRFVKPAVNAVTSLTGSNGPDYLMLTHVDDTADHGKWAAAFPNLKRIFHSGDLGKYNWVGDTTLQDVEILLPTTTSKDTPLPAFSINGQELDANQMEQEDVVVLHTPGHSPGSITLWKKGTSAEHPGILFTGDTYGYTTRTQTMTGFPQYGNNLRQQAHTLEKLLEFSWDVIAPGHGHPRDYTQVGNKEQVKQTDVEDAVQQMTVYRRW